MCLIVVPREGGLNLARSGHDADAGELSALGGKVDIRWRRFNVRF